MHTPIKTVLIAAAALSLSAAAVIAQPAIIPAGPRGGCPAGYHPGVQHMRCYLNAGRPWIPAGPRGGCGPGYHPGPWGARCYANGRQEWIPAGPRGGCPAGYRPGPQHQRCYPI